VIADLESQERINYKATAWRVFIGKGKIPGGEKHGGCKLTMVEE
jgi:hypothetical protein